MSYSSRSSYIWNVVKQRILSIPHYVGELAELRSARDLGAWVYYKWPVAFPLAAFPPYVTVESTNACNFACGHCWRSKMDRSVGFLDVELFRKIVVEIKGHRQITLKLGGTGEIGLHRHLNDLMATLTGLNGIRIFLYTNGTVLQKYSHHEILDWNIDIMVVSVDGTDPDSYNKLRLGGDYFTLRRQIEEFQSLRSSLRKKAPRIEIRHVIMPCETTRELIDFRRDWLKIADAVKFNYLIPLDKNETANKSPVICRHIRREFCIEWDGRVRFCSFYPEYLGDLHFSTIENLWNSPSANFVRECHLRGDLDRVPACRGCI